jgi:hypothetical protein
MSVGLVFFFGVVFCGVVVLTGIKFGEIDKRLEQLEAKLEKKE